MSNHPVNPKYAELEKYSWWQSGSRHFCLIDKQYSGSAIELRSIVLLEYLSTQPSTLPVDEMLNLVQTGKMVKGTYISNTGMSLS